MTPAIKLAESAKINFTLHEYKHDPRAESYGLEAVHALKVAAAQVFKTLVICLENKGVNTLGVAVVPVSSRLSLKQAAKALGAKKCSMALSQDVERSTGYVLGGVSPLGQKRQLATVIDQSANEFESLYVSAGKRGLEIELSADDLASLTSAVFADIKEV